MDESQTRRNRTAAQDGEDVRPEGRRLSPFSFVEGVLLPRLENGIVAACAFAILLTVTLHISFRYLGQSFRWTEEAARLGTIWGTFFAVPIFVRRRGLLAITVLHPRMSQRALARLSI